MSIKAILKIGGSLGRGDGLPALCAEISSLSGKYPLLIIPGGGEFADCVRQAQQRWGFSEKAAHRMALLAMDQYGYMLQQLIAGSSLTEDLSLARRSASEKPSIFLPSSLLMRKDPLPNSWQVTSDSIAGWIAHETGCNQLILLKDVDGLMGSDQALIKEMTVKELEAHRGGVDEFLSVLLRKHLMETWVINGLYPDRLALLLESGKTIGTYIKRS
jgi:5-(aminomethyl)-3-furanmethanol phosphate kinase